MFFGIVFDVIQKIIEFVVVAEVVVVIGFLPFEFRELVLVWEFLNEF